MEQCLLIAVVNALFACSSDGTGTGAVATAGAPPSSAAGQVAGGGAGSAGAMSIAGMPAIADASGAGASGSNAPGAPDAPDSQTAIIVDVFRVHFGTIIRRMSEHTATIAWRRGEQVFTDGKYSRAHQWSFDGGATVAASSSPSSVRVPWSDPAGVDPEEAFVAAISSCHMLWFLHLAAREQLVIESYVDDAIGVLGKTSAGKTGFTRVTLRPRITWGDGTAPDTALLDRLHHEAHELCFIASSTTAEIVVQARGLEG